MTNTEKSVFGNSPPPRATDVLFGPNKKDWHLNACIQHWGEVNHAYKLGFRTAALQLVGSICEEPVDQDLMIYPIVYLYRHHIELSLKDIYRYGAGLLGRDIPADDEKVLGSHDLLRLWDIVNPLLEPICALAGENQLPSDDIQGISSYIRQISKHDPDGARFRYSTIKRKKPNAPKGTFEHRRSLEDEKLILVNIRQFAIHLEKLGDYLDGLGRWISDMYDMKNEMQNGGSD